MNKPAATALLILLFSSIFVAFNPVHAATSVSGSITSNTTWTKANSPYQITSWLTVQEGVTLTIEPGVTLDMNGWYMSVLGHLHAQGKTYNQIHFISEREGFAPGIYLQQQSSDCIIENVVLDKVGLTVRGSTTKINNNIFRQSQSAAIEVESSATITGNVFEDIPTKGISVTGDSIVTNNLFNRTTGQATAIIATGNAHIASNQITGFYQGIALAGSVTAENNVIINCSYGGIASVDSAPTAKGNYISGNTYGIKGGGTIESNTIIDNEYGIILDMKAKINDNNIVNNLHGISLTTTGTFDAPNNYWGNVDSSTVSSLITDSQDDPALGTVNFKPILTSPSTTAPTDETIKEIAATTGTSGSSMGFLIFFEDNIFLIAEIVIVGIVIAWVIVLAVVLVKKRRRHKRS
jgi:parallel beta-helix repeat protein